MKESSLARLAIAMTAVAALSGCVAGNEVKMEQVRNTTIGQELIDLERAKEQGLLSDVEYYQLKEEILKGGPVHVTINGHHVDS
ncbi:hypothetical protein [Biformimicrobium ophioploci]|uniref:Lipoprotein n=1 Tax=Biformimicrobium ophioploci TaxID=3036711 RepID=A0ABQ6LWA3_9GAMM|nr:hypothetical protein [Microbulbifer sp. NKW57]GMG86372.1 hypothetical protein MNKW57_06930 [Microbulbifer sp. NKW57]